MAKVEVHTNECVGCGMCVGQFPKYFEFNEDGLSTTVKEEVDDEDLEELKETVEYCPTGAIEVNED